MLFNFQFSEYSCCLSAHSVFSKRIKIWNKARIRLAYTIVKSYHLPQTSSPILASQPSAAFNLPPSPPDTPIHGDRKPSAVHSGEKGNPPCLKISCSWPLQFNNWHNIELKMTHSCFGYIGLCKMSHTHIHTGEPQSPRPYPKPHQLSS